MQVGISEPRVLARLADGSAERRASHPGFDMEKPHYHFVMRGESLLLDNVQVGKIGE